MVGAPVQTTSHVSRACLSRLFQGRPVTFRAYGTATPLAEVVVQLPIGEDQEETLPDGHRPAARIAVEHRRLKLLEVFLHTNPRTPSAAVSSLGPGVSSLGGESSGEGGWACPVKAGRLRRQDVRLIGQHRQRFDILDLVVKGDTPVAKAPLKFQGVPVDSDEPALLRNVVHAG